MPKAQLITANDDITDVFDTVIDDDTGKKTSQQARLEDIIEDLNNTDNDATMSVYRQSPLGGKAAMTFLASFAPDKYTMDELQLWLRDNFGSGDYRVQIRSGGRIRANKLISVEAPKVETDIRHPTSEAGEVLNVVMQAIEKQNQMLAAALQTNQTSEDDLLRRMVTYKQLFSSDSGGNTIGQIRDTLALVEDLRGEVEPKDDGFGAVIDKLAPIAEAVAKNPQPQPQPQPQQPKQNPSPRQGHKSMNILHAGLATLLRAAKKGADTGFYADFILDQLPAEKVASFLVDKGAFDKLVILNPDVVAYKAWFDDLAEHVKAQIGMESKYAEQYKDLNPSFENDINGEMVAENDDDSSAHVHPS